MDVVLVDQLLAACRERTVELRVVPQRHCTGLQDKGHRGEPCAALLGLALEPRPKLLQSRDVRLVELGDVGHIEPAALHVGGGELVQLAALGDLHRAEFGKVDFRYRRNSRTGDGSGLATERFLHKLLQVFLEHAAPGPGPCHLVQRHPEFPGQLAHGRAGVNPGAFTRRGCRFSVCR